MLRSKSKNYMYEANRKTTCILIPQGPPAPAHASAIAMPMKPYPTPSLLGTGAVVRTRAEVRTRAAHSPPTLRPKIGLARSTTRCWEAAVKARAARSPPTLRPKVRWAAGNPPTLRPREAAPSLPPPASPLLPLQGASKRVTKPCWQALAVTREGWRRARVAKMATPSCKCKPPTCPQPPHYVTTTQTIAIHEGALTSAHTALHARSNYLVGRLCVQRKHALLMFNLTCEHAQASTHSVARNAIIQYNRNCMHGRARLPRGRQSRGVADPTADDWAADPTADDWAAQPGGNARQTMCATC